MFGIVAKGVQPFLPLTFVPLNDSSPNHFFLLLKVPIDVFQGITDEDAAKVVDGLAPKTADRKDSIEQVKKLYKLFCECDCTLLEVSFNFINFIFCNLHIA